MKLKLGHAISTHIFIPAFYNWTNIKMLKGCNLDMILLLFIFTHFLVNMDMKKFFLTHFTSELQTSKY